ncbi:MAG: GNAT family N-acetyltransferase [Gammaproteobacteria bacterium]|nr:GNAT family N-acetyltransferase [Gammaproteobacteria bacterium]
MTLVNDSEWIKNIGDRNVHTLEDARAYLTKSYLANYERNNFGLYLTTLKDGTPIGMCGLIKRDGLDDVDIGFAFMPAWRGRGYAVEAARQSLIYGRDVLKKSRVVAIVLPTNTSSIAVLTKIGCQFEKMIQLPHNPEPLALYAKML